MFTSNPATIFLDSILNVVWSLLAPDVNPTSLRRRIYVGCLLCLRCVNILIFNTNVWVGAFSSQPFVLVLDQFEEFFRYRNNYDKKKFQNEKHKKVKETLSE